MSNALGEPMMNWTGPAFARVPADAASGGAVVVNTPTRGALLAALESRLAAGEGFTVATLNLDHVVKLRRDPAFRAAYGRHSHVVADGNPIVWLNRLAGQPTELVPGSDLVDPVAALAARMGAPIALVGSTEAALGAAAEALVRRHPGLKIAARIAPPMGFDPEGPGADEVIAQVRASGARVCFLALGAPKQEVFAARAAGDLPGVGFLSIGAGLDFLSGAQVRAPRWVRAIAAEWLWRLAGNPRRLAQRYGACLVILPGLARTALVSRRSSRHD